jgi:hypothetical protein
MFVVVCNHAYLTYVLYNLGILCSTLLCFARICTLLSVSAIKWYPTINV